MIAPSLYPGIVSAWWRYRAFEPARVTPRSIARWLAQYDACYRSDLLALLRGVTFLTKEQVVTALVAGHQRIERDLAEDGIPAEQIVYVSVGDAGSSSPVMLNLLRDAASFERRKIPVLDSRDAMGLSNLTAQLNRGAIVYVDDFAGSGRQFIKARQFATPYIAGSFSEFFLTSVMCEEAEEKIAAAAVQPVTGLLHRKSDRPFNEASTLLRPKARAALLELGKRLHETHSLGFMNLGTNVVLYRNPPNSTPLLLRGSLGQKPFFGVLPATSDLPVLRPA